MRQSERWRIANKIALTRECPVCFAAPTWPCVRLTQFNRGDTATELKHPHKARRKKGAAK